MEIYGYKAFDKGLINRYGTKFEIGKSYSINDGNVKWGNEGNGFHFCKNLEDTIRYFDAMGAQIDICEVKGSGETVEYEDDYNGYYEMYAASDIEILRLLSREEIIAHMLNKWELPQRRFIQGYKLTEEEIDMFLTKEPKLYEFVEYYQRGNENVFKFKN